MKARKKIKVRLKSETPVEQTATLQRFRPPQNLPLSGSRSARPPMRGGVPRPPLPARPGGPGGSRVRPPNIRPERSDTFRESGMPPELPPMPMPMVIGSPRPQASVPEETRKWIPQSLDPDRVMLGSLVGYLPKGTWPTRMCFTCGCPIAIFGWLAPCRHLYCLACADFMKKANKCGRCSAIVAKVESMDFDDESASLVSECPVAQCAQAFFDQASAQQHMATAHPRIPRPAVPPPPSDPRVNRPSSEAPRDDEKPGDKRPLEGEVSAEPPPLNETRAPATTDTKTEEPPRTSEPMETTS